MKSARRELCIGKVNLKERLINAFGCAEMVA